ncbi:MAG: class I adenylate-forming enzyme family protein [Maritimibacter sp.]
MTWLHDLIEAHPEKAAAIIDHDGATITYGALRAATIQLAEQLSGAGLRPGDRLMLISENSASYAAALMAASRIGAWVMPLNARQSVDELDSLKAHSGARMMIFTGEASEPARAHATHYGARTIGHTSIGATLIAGPFDAEGTAPEPLEDTPKERVAALMYTTGTTSAPKGVMLTHENLTWNAKSSARLREIKTGDIVIGVLPGSHIFGFSSAFLAAMHAGGTIRFMPRFSPGAVLDVIAQGASVLPAVPQMYQALLSELEARGLKKAIAPKLHYISSGGAPLDPEWKERIEAAFSLPLHNGYGLTETSPGVCGGSNAKPRTDMALGEILPDVECIIDAPDEKGIGELLIRGPNIMKGYYRNEDATNHALRDDGFFRSGDIAKIDPDGAVWLLGRLKELIIRSGFNVYPPEVEAMLTRHPDILQTAVVGRQVTGNEEIIAFVTAKPGLTEPAIKAFLHDHLVSYKVPQHVIIIDAFPAAATGKILKHKLLSTFADQLAARDASAS